MAKERISSIDLGWIVLQQMKESDNCPIGLSLAVVADRSDGWRAVVQTRSRRSLPPQFTRRLAAVQKKLQAVYALIDD